jgi:hypothetical protein
LAPAGLCDRRGRLVLDDPARRAILIARTTQHTRVDA